MHYAFSLTLVIIPLFFSLLFSIDAITSESPSDAALIRIGKHRISVSRLPPYSSWEEFLPLIQKAFKCYLTMATPTNIHRIGLRYINRIDFESEKVNLDDYFMFRPFTGNDLPQDMAGFRLVAEFEQPQGQILRAGLVHGGPRIGGKLGVILDLDYFQQKVQPISEEEVRAWVEVAHGRVEEFFEASITDQLREKLGKSR